MVLILPSAAVLTEKFNSYWNMARGHMHEWMNQLHLSEKPAWQEKVQAECYLSRFFGAVNFVTAWKQCSFFSLRAGCRRIQSDFKQHETKSSFYYENLPTL